MQNMYRITYISESTIQGDQAYIKEQIESILASATKNNPALGITGALLYSGGYFCQVIEGNEDEIERLYETIQMDGRHANVTILSYEECDTRLFAEWAMAFAGIEDTLKFSLEGLKDSPSELRLKEVGKNIINRLEAIVVKKQAS